MEIKLDKLAKNRANTVFVLRVFECVSDFSPPVLETQKLRKQVLFHVSKYEACDDEVLYVHGIYLEHKLPSLVSHISLAALSSPHA